MGAAVVLDHVVKRFGAVPALNRVSLEVAAGTIFGLLGSNGAGKTTAVRILATLTRPDAGAVAVHGHDVARQAATVRRLVGVVGQYPGVDDRLTGRENLVLVGRLHGGARGVVRPRAGQLLEQFGLASAADRQVRTYSGGMRRRLDLAAALIGDPEVLLLDEPTVGLDPSARLQLWAALTEIVMGGTTVLLTTQYLEETDRLANRVAILDRGVVRAEGSPRELKARYGRAVVQVQVPPDDQRPRFAAALSGLGDVQLDTANEDALQVRISGDVSVADVVRRLDAAELRSAAIWSRPASLDDVYLALTSPATQPKLAERGGFRPPWLKEVGA
jgi:ABC-2 type transport system ATP-binding protein